LAKIYEINVNSNVLSLLTKCQRTATYSRLFFVAQQSCITQHVTGYTPRLWPAQLALSQREVGARGQTRLHTRVIKAKAPLLSTQTNLFH